MALATRFLSTFLFILAGFFIQAQYRVTFIIDQLPAYQIENDAVYLAGSFNNWNPGDNKLRLTTINNKKGITIQLQHGTYEYKFTRGSWKTVEVAPDGKSKQNRSLEVDNDTTINIEIPNWADHFNHPERTSTANKNVHLLDSSFYMPQLDRYRRIWIYLPDSYYHTKKRYPVLYMHDGQNVFDDATSFAGEWGVDEALDSLGKTVGEAIVVAIDNGADKRMNEYSPYDMEKYGEGEGSKYVDFLVKSLKPVIDKNFRTKKTHEHTFIAGSSMGGLISLYAILKYPKVFGGAGIFSPAIWIAPDIKNDVVKRGKKVKGKIYFYAGKQESDQMVPDMLAIFESLHKVSSAKIETVIRTDGKHTEANWRSEFPQFFKFLMK
ncbi:MAG: alpha/beta hydrolase-fold protein [Flavisolibacter sp.]